MKKILSMLSLALTLLAFGWAQTASATKTVYLQPNSNWPSDGARFALYVFNDEGNTWVSMTATGATNVYSASFDDTVYPKMIFVRMNGATTENNWDNKWNQSADLDAPSADNQLYRMNDGTWDPQSGDFNVTSYYSTENFNYIMNFPAVTTSNVPDFAAASNWDHIVSSYKDYWDDEAYINYQYMTDSGIDGSSCLRVYTNQKTSGTYDLLVTPRVSGTVVLFVKPVGKYYNDSAFLEFYSLNEDGTAKGSVLATTSFSDKSNSEEWDWYPLTITLDSEQRIGIRGSQVLMDDFCATNATIEAETKMVVAAVMNSDGATGTSGTNPQFDQGDDGNTVVTLKVKVDNTGDVDLVSGSTENYTLTLGQGSSSNNITYFEDATIDVPVNIAAGESATFDVEFKVPATTGYTYFFIRENIKGKTNSTGRYAVVNKYASKFIFDKSGTTYYSSSSATTTAIDLGKITEETTVNYEIYNSGSAPLTINSFTVPAPYTTDAPTGEFTVAGGEKKQIAITLPADNPGIFAGNVEIQYTNFGEATKTYTLGISGTILDPSKNLITFSNKDDSNGQFPVGSIHSDEVYISYDSPTKNYYLQSTGNTTKFITPLLTAEAGESFTYDAWYKSYSYNSSVVVYISKDRENWTQIAKETYSSGIGSSAKTFTATIPEAGDYYLAFELLNNALIDNIYGLTLAEAPEHDWYITASDVPTTGTQNADYSASITLKNISADADNLTATLYVDGEAVATQEVALEGNDKTAAEGTGRNDYSNIEEPTTVELTYRPKVAGEFPTYIELKAGETVYKTEGVTLVIAEEELKSDASLDVAGYNGNNPLNLYYKNSESVSLYTSAILKDEFGLRDGAKISSITYKGYGPSSSYTSTLNVWYQWVDDTAQDKLEGSAEYDVTGMTSVIAEDEHEWAYGGSASDLVDLITLNFDEPLVYEEGKSLRIVVRATSDSYKNGFNWEKSTISTHPESGQFVSYRHMNDGTKGVFTGAWSYENLPAIHLGLVVEPTSYAGVVTDAITKAAIEGATVTLYDEANDVQYQGTTDVEGNFSVDVIQNTGDFQVTVTAEGYADEVLAETVSFTEGTVADQALTPSPVVDVTISESTYATFFYQDKAFEVPEGVKAYVAVKGDTEISLTEIDVIPAGCAVLLNGAEGDYQFKQVASAPAYTGENSLVGSEEGGKYDEAGYKYYVLSWKNKNKNIDEVGFYFLSGSKGAYAKVKAHQAYMRVAAASANEAGYIFNFDADTTTGIANIERMQLTDNDAIYTLSGVRVSADRLQRGIYIVNGKKVVVK